MRRPAALPAALLVLLAAHTGARADAPAALFRRAAPRDAAVARAGPVPAPLDVVLDRDALRAFRAGRGGRVALPLADGPDAVLALERFEVLAPGAVVTVTGPGGPRAYRPDLALFRGPLEGEPGSLAVLAVAPDEVTGWIERAGGRLLLHPSPGGAAGAHRVTPEEDLPAPGPFRCPSDDLEGDGPPTAAALPALPQDVQATTTRLVCEIALDCDQDFFVKEGSDTSRAVRYVLTMLGTTSSIYEREINVALQATYLNLWTTVDPYSATDLDNALPEFRDWWNANRAGVSRDLAQLVTGRALGGGIAYVNVLCGGTYGYSVIGNLNGYNTYPNALTTWDVNVMAHELGHNFSSRHTHSCWWQTNGYAPAGALLDSCYTPEGTCAPGASPHSPPDRGTIMSYCHLIGGIGNVRLDFHTASRSVMRYASEHASCFAAATVQPPLGLAVSPTAAGAALSWSASPTAGVLRYDVFRSALPQDLAPVRVGTAAGTTFTDRALGTFWYKLRAVRAADSSGFGGEARGAACAPSAPSPWTVGAGPVGVAAADFDEDGILDLAVTNFGGHSVSVLRGLGTAGVPSGTFAAAVPVALPAGSYPAGLAAADLDGDGILDLAVTREEALAVSVLWGQGAGGTGDGTFVPGPSCAVTGNPWAVTDGDFDADGIPDLAVATTSGVCVLRGQGAGGVPDRTFAPAVRYAAGGAAYGLVSGDFDEDGITDLAAAAGVGVNVLRGNGAAGVGDGTFAAAVPYACQSAPGAIVTGDFDDDGITDLAVANGSSASVSVLRGDGAGGRGDGTFAAALHFGCGYSPNGIVAGDWDGDGVTDLAVSNGSSAGTVSVLTGRGNGTFAAAQAFAAGTSVRALAAGDLDGDGVADFAAVNNLSPGSVSTLLTTCPSPQPMTLRVLEPAAGAAWLTGSRRTIAWSRARGVRAVDLAVTRDGGASWRTLAHALTDTTFEWTVTGPYAAAVRFRVQDPAVPAHAALSDSAVTVLPAELVDATIPTGPARLALLGVRPNPARGRAEAWFTLADHGPARLELLDLAGRRVRTLDAGRGPGPGRADLGGTAALRPGLYLVRLVQGDRAVTGKMVVTR